VSRPAFTFRELDQLRGDLRRALERNGHVLPPLAFRAVARVVAHLDKSAEHIESDMAEMLGMGHA
jgi:hypothetical protein